MPVAVSVVVPVYNTSRYLSQCVDSLVNQTLKDVEFIFVDDGSTDNSVEILKQYQAKDARIKILQQENQYAGVARNNGMKQATGKYIIFLDSDDFFKPTMLEKAFRCAEKNQAEIVAFGNYRYDNETGTIEKKPFTKKAGRIYSSTTLGKDVFSSIDSVPWNKLYLKQYIEKKGLTFQHTHSFNDGYFAHLSVVLAERIIFLNKRLVYYRINNSESIQGKNPFAYDCLIERFSALKKALVDNGIFQTEIQEAYNKRAGSTIVYYANKRAENLVSKQFYYSLKKNLIPNLFDMPEDFADEPILKSVYDSEDYNNYILLLVEYQKENTVSKKSKDYILGHALLAIPRKIKHALQTAKR